MAKVCYNFGETIRSCEKLKKERDFEQCIEKLNGLIMCLEEESKTLDKPALVSQMELLSLAYNYRGQIFYLMVDFDAAINDYSQALKYNTRMATAFYNRALIHYRMGRFETAVDDLEEAVKLNPAYDDAKECLKTVRTANEEHSRSDNKNTSKPD